MGKLMHNNFKIFKILKLRKFSFWFEILISHIYHSNIFHSSDSKFRNKYIVILFPSKLCTKEIFIEINGCFKYSKEISWIDVFQLRFSNSNSNWNSKLLVIFNMHKWTSIHSINVSTDWRGIIKDMQLRFWINFCSKPVIFQKVLNFDIRFFSRTICKNFPRFVGNNN